MIVYLIKSIEHPGKKYVGLTHDLELRLEEHNSGAVKSTWKYRPWKLEVSIYFNDCKKADDFEKYLKHGSGYTFAKRHFW